MAATVTRLAAAAGFTVDWPEWAINTFVGIGLACTVLAIIQALIGGPESSGDRDGAGGCTSPGGSKTAGSAKQLARFRRFQLTYLAPFLTVMLSDWLQGTNMYTLYQSYDVNVGALFLTGFSSSAVFGTFLGHFVDRFGRRAGCMTFCVLELVINALEHFPSMPLLLAGRVLGGMSTSLLFSAFESWMVSEHRRRGFPEDWLASTFSFCTVGNGIVAIVAGVVAQLAADRLGDIGPFQVALVLTAAALAMLFAWTENYGAGHGPSAASGSSSTPSQGTAAAAEAAAARGNGKEAVKAAAAGAARAPPKPAANGHAGAPSNGGNGHGDGGGNGRSSSHGESCGISGGGGGMAAGVAAAWRCVKSDPRVLLLGLVQSLFEGAMYTFVFMWVPTLQGVAPGGKLPTGLVFSSFMVCITAGGMLVPTALRVVSVEAGSCAVFALAAAAMAAPAFAHDLPTVLGACLVLETCVGAFFACAGLMRSKYLPDDLQGSIMNLFRLPLNVLVVVGTLLTDHAAPPVVFGVVSLWFAAAALLQARLWATAGAAAVARDKPKQE
ncbi:unnamed protein product [Phaeothamnion confervicola]